jgi:hypothetical protein
MASPQELIDALENIKRNASIFTGDADIKADTTVEQIMTFAKLHTNGHTPAPAQKPVHLPASSTLDAIVKTLQKNPSGLSSEHLQKLLNIPKPVWVKAKNEGLESGVLKTKGEKRGTKYFVK